MLDRQSQFLKGDISSNNSACKLIWWSVLEKWIIYCRFQSIKKFVRELRYTCYLGQFNLESNGEMSKCGMLMRALPPLKRSTLIWLASCTLLLIPSISQQLQPLHVDKIQRIFLYVWNFRCHWLLALENKLRVWSFFWGHTRVAWIKYLLVQCPLPMPLLTSSRSMFDH